MFDVRATLIVRDRMRCHSRNPPTLMLESSHLGAGIVYPPPSSNKKKEEKKDTRVRAERLVGRPLSLLILSIGSQRRNGEASQLREPTDE